MTVEKYVNIVFWLSAFILSSLIGLLIGLNVNAQTNEEALQVEQIKLRASDIQYSETKIFNVYDNEYNIVGTNEVVDYSYLGNEVDANLAIFKEGEKYTNIEKVDNQTSKVYTTPRYFKNDNGQVQEIINTRVPKAIWDASTVKTTVEKIEALLKTPYVIAADVYNLSDDAAMISGDNSSWSSTKTGINVAINSSEDTAVHAQWWDGNGRYYLNRYYLNFDTSGLDGTIATASIKVTGSDTRLGSAYTCSSISMNVATTTAADTITTSDWNKIGSTTLSTDISCASFNKTGINEFALNATGTASINIGGISKFVILDTVYDLANSAPTGDGGWAEFKDSTTANPPYLEITMEEEEPENPTATTTADFYPCSIPTNSRIDIITGCKNIYNGTTSSSTITAVEFYYYQIPFAIWVVLGSMLIYLFVRLRFEYIIRFRK